MNLSPYLKRKYVACFLFVPLFLVSCAKEKEPDTTAVVTSEARTLGFTVKMVLQHDPQAFTQGLDFVGDTLYESTGGNGSWIAKVDQISGKQDKKVILKSKYFGEGITILHNKVYQLTWQNKEGFVYDLRTFKKTHTFNYDTEGWGITTDNQQLIMSDGSATLFFLDTAQLKIVKKVLVKEKGTPIDKLNELEYIEGYVFANRWQTDIIYKIDPTTGEVVGKLDFTAIANEIRRENPRVDVLNGIAYNEKTKEIMITGKRWPKAFVVVLN